MHNRALEQPIALPRLSFGLGGSEVQGGRRGEDRTEDYVVEEEEKVKKVRNVNGG